MRTSTRSIFKHVFALLTTLAALSALAYSGWLPPNPVLSDVKQKLSSVISLPTGSPKHVLETFTNFIENGSFGEGIFTSGTSKFGEPPSSSGVDQPNLHSAANLTGCGCTAASLLNTNGSFEASFTGGNSGGSFVGLTFGDTPIVTPGWSFGSTTGPGGSYAQEIPGTSYYDAQEGEYHYLAYVPAGEPNEGGWAETTVNVQSGKNYNVCFHIAPGGKRNHDNDQWFDIITSGGWNVTVSGAATATGDFDVNPANFDSGPTAVNPTVWTQHNLSFTASSTGTVTIRFRAYGEPSGWQPYAGLYLDNVAVCEATPPVVCTIPTPTATTCTGTNVFQNGTLEELADAGQADFNDSVSGVAASFLNKENNQSTGNTASPKHWTNPFPNPFQDKNDYNGIFYLNNNGNKLIWMRNGGGGDTDQCLAATPGNDGYANYKLKPCTRYKFTVKAAGWSPSSIVSGSDGKTDFFIEQGESWPYTKEQFSINTTSDCAAIQWSEYSQEFTTAGTSQSGTLNYTLLISVKDAQRDGLLIDNIALCEIGPGPLCTLTCTKPTLGTSVTTAPGTCTGTTPNNDATASLTVTGGDKADIFEGTTYGSGPAYGAGTNKTVTAGAVSFTGLKHNTDYTIRVWNADNACFEDKSFKTLSKNCTVVSPCPNNLLQNPSFEQGISSTVLSQTPPPGWIGGIAAGFPSGFSPAEGDAFGYTLDDANPTLCQDVTATAGSSYTLTFYAGVNQVMGQKVTLQYYNGTTPIGTAQEHIITHLLSTGQFGGPYTLTLSNAPSNATKIRVCAVGISGNQTAGAAKIDAVCLTETPCVKPTATAAASDPTCASGSSTVNSDGKITLSGFGANDKYDYTTGATYSGTATYASGSTTIPAGGVIVSNLANPSGTSQQYTIRIFNAEGCFIDRTVTINKVTCNCTTPVLTDLTNQAICEGGTFTSSNVTTSVTNAVTVTYQWFNDNGTANPTTTAISGQTTATLTALPTAVGVYKYRVEATNSADPTCKTSKSVTLTVSAKPTATAAATDPTCASGSSTVNSDGKITLSGFGPTDKYAYTTGATYSGTATYASGSTTIPAGGVIVSNLANPSGATQQYTVRIFNAEGCFIDRTVTINKVTCSCTTPVLTDLTNQAICEGGTFTSSNVTTSVTNAVTVTYQWFNDNGTANPTTTAISGQTTATLTALPTAVGVYKYRVEATNSADPTCKTSKSVTLTVSAPANAGNDGNTTVCDYSTAPIDLSSLITGEATGGVWTRTSGTGGTFNAAAGTFTVSAGTTTSTFTYTVAGTAPCPDDASVATVTVNAKPNAGTDQTLACANAITNTLTTSTTLSPNPTGGTYTQIGTAPATATITGNNVTNMTVAGTYQFEYTLNGCKDTVAVTVEPCTGCVKPDAGPDAPAVCQPTGTAKLTAVTAGGTWTAQAGNPAPAVIDANGNITGLNTAGTYKFIYSVTGGGVICTDTAQVIVNAKPNIIDGNATICAGETVDLTSKIVNYATLSSPVWTIATAAGTAVTTPTAVNPTVTTTYVLVAQNAAGCKDTASVVVTVNPKPTITIANGFPVCRQNGTAYSIKFVATAGTVTTVPSLTVTGDSIANIPLTTASVKLIITNTGGCKDSITVTAPTCDKPVGSIGDLIWKDVNDNGLQDLPTEKGVAGVKVNLYAAAAGTKTGAVLQTKTTDAAGLYLFSGLVAGDYIVEIDKTSLKDTCTITTKQNIGSDDTNDSDFNPTTGLSQVITLNPVFNPTTPAEILATNNLTVDAGLVKVCIKSKVTLTGSPVCSTDLLTYSLTFSVANKVGTVKVNTGTLNGTNPYTVTGIPSGTSVMITDSLSAVCKWDTLITGPNCNVQVDLALKKSINTKIAQLGDLLTYTLKVWNESNTNATGVEVTDSIATTVQFQTGSFTASRGSAVISGNVIKWTIGNIAANGDTVTLTYKVKATQEGVHFNTAEISKTNEKDIDSTPGNGKEGEDDIDSQCFTVPIKLCPGEKVQASVPAYLTNVQWFKNGTATAVASGNTVLLTETGSYRFTATNQTCPIDGCCPVIIEPGTNCCPEDLCIPFTIQKRKK